MKDISGQLWLTSRGTQVAPGFVPPSISLPAGEQGGKREKVYIEGDLFLPDFVRRTVALGLNLAVALV